MSERGMSGVAAHPAAWAMFWLYRLQVGMRRVERSFRRSVSGAAWGTVGLVTLRSCRRFEDGTV